MTYGLKFPLIEEKGCESHSIPFLKEGETLPSKSIFMLIGLLLSKRTVKYWMKRWKEEGYLEM